MMVQHTIGQLKSLRLDGMAQAFEEQLAQSSAGALCFEERVAMLVEREIARRDSRRVARLLKQARLKLSAACLEDVDYRPGRGLDRPRLASLASCDWIRHAHNVILCGATGSGKTWLACALGNAACRQGFSVYYTRLPRLFEELRIAHGDGSFTRRLAQLAKTDLLLIDDWGLAAPAAQERADLLEVLDDRVGTRATVLTSQLPVKHWHDYLGEPTLADAILDRVLHSAHRLDLQGESLRNTKKA